MTTLLAMFRRPDGGPDALATLEHRYLTEHLPVVAATPGLRAIEARRVTGALAGESDLSIVTTMEFDDRAALDAGLASEPMRAGGRTLREIAPHLLTLLVLEPLSEVSGDARPGDGDGAARGGTARDPDGAT